MKLHRSLLRGASLLALNTALVGTAITLMPQQALASCQTVSGDTIISDSSIDCITWDSSDISITSAGTIAGSVTGVLNSGNSVGTLTNSGSIGGTGGGIYNEGGAIGTITNNSGGSIGGGVGIANYTSSYIGTIGNSGLIVGYGSGIWNNGSIGDIPNSGTIGGGDSGIYNFGPIGTITNSGLIGGDSGAGIYNFGTIGTITNSGTISGSIAGIYNAGVIGGGATAINSTGTIINGISNSGIISGNITVNQSLTITGGIGTLTGGTITTNNNDLLLDSNANQVLNDAVDVGASNSFSLAGTMRVNSTVSVTGNYVQVSGAELVIGGTNASDYGNLVISGSAAMTDDRIGLAGALANGETMTIVQASDSGTDYSGITVAGEDFAGAVSSLTGSGVEDLIVTLSTGCQIVGSSTNIGSNVPCVVWTGGHLTIAGGVSVSGASTGIVNSGSSVGTLTNTGSISGSIHGLYNDGTIAAIVNSGMITGGTIGIYNDSSGTIGSLTNTGSIGGSTAGVYNSGTIAALTNSGTISGNIAGIYNAVGGSIGLIANTSGGTISNGTVCCNTGAIANFGAIATITNSGIITSGPTGTSAISNSGEISLIANASGGTISGATYSGIVNGGIIGTIINSGLISASYTGGINNSGTIGTITNSGTIINSRYGGIENGGTIGLITNTGLIANDGIINNYFGVENDGTIGTITNSGTISGVSGGISNSGTIGSIINSGIISGPTAIKSTGTILSAISNTGTISGNIDVSQGLTITGGNASTIGTLTGYQGSIGTITATNLTFDSNAYQLLNDDVVVGSGSGTVTNEGTLKIGAGFTPTITGNYVGSGDTLIFGVTDASGYGALTITGDASLTGTSVSLSGATIAGESFTIVDADSSSDYTSITAFIRGFTTSISSITGIGFDDLVVAAASTNCQIVGSGGAVISGSVPCVLWNSSNVSITGGGVVSGANTGIINTGNSVGTLTNSGSITGLYNSGSVAAIVNSGTIGGGAFGIFNDTGGSLSAITNTIGGTISGGTYGILNFGTIAAIVNSGAITGGTYGIINDIGGNIAAITNGISGTVSGGYSGILNEGSIGIITNSGGISGYEGVLNYGGSIGAITNSGSISGGSIGGIWNFGGTIGSITNTIGGVIIGGSIGIGNGTTHGTIASTIGTISNSGSIGGGEFGIVNYGEGTIGTITNSGSISGGEFGIVNYGGGTIGTITNTIGGTVSGVSGGISNSGTIGTITNSGSINGSITGIYNSGSVVAIVNSGSISGGNIGIWNDIGGNIAAITNGISGTVSGGYSGILNEGSIGAITNSGTVSGTYVGIWNAGSIGTLTNSIGGVISGGFSGILNNGSIDAVTNASGGAITGTSIAGIVNGTTGGSVASTISTITNSGSIGGGEFGIVNYGGSIGAITNSGSIGGDDSGLLNFGTIGTITNSIGGVIRSSHVGIDNVGSIAAITNGGVIGGGTTGGIDNQIGNIGAITNSGTITGDNWGITNDGSIGAIINSSIGVINGGSIAGIANGTTGGSVASTITAITNSGSISGGEFGIVNWGDGSIGTISNTGTISGVGCCGSGAGISNQSGTIGAITNSGLISGLSAAIYSSGTILSAITNTGTIAGNINVNQDLTITGGNSSTIGTLTGYNGSIGTITANNLTFDSNAYQLLNDDVTVGAGSGTVTNEGTVKLTAAHTITGNYLQNSDAVLAIGVASSISYGNLIVTGNVTMPDAHISILGAVSSGESFTIVQDSGTANYTGDTATVGGGYTGSVSSITGIGFDDLIVALSGGGSSVGPYGSIGAAAGGTGAAVGAALDQIQTIIDNGGDASLAPVLAALNAIGSISGTAAEAAAIKQLAPNQVAPPLIVTNAVATQTARVIEQHQLSLLEDSSEGGYAGSIGRAAGSAYLAGSFWMQAMGGFANSEATENSDGYHQGFYGLTFGADRHLTANSTVGLALSWVQSNATGFDALAGSSVSQNAYQATFYGTQRFGPAFVNVQAGLGYNFYDESRDISFLGQSARAAYGGMQYMGKIEGGWDFPVFVGTVSPISAMPIMPLHILTVTPLAGFQIVAADNNGYTEHGSSADLTVGQQDIDSYETSLGGQVKTTFATNWGYLTPEFKAAWVHDLDNTPISSQATLGGVGFTTETPRVAVDGAQITVAATLQATDAITLRAEYDGDLRSAYQSQSGLVKFEWSF